MWKSTPAASASLASAPTPIPNSRIRPRDSWSIVASRLASTTGWWNGSSSTDVPSRSRSVTPATKLSTSSGSAIGVSAAIGTRPSVTPGYSAMCSVVKNDSNPHSSACRASPVTRSGSIPKNPVW